MSNLKSKNPRVGALLFGAAIILFFCACGAGAIQEQKSEAVDSLCIPLDTIVADTAGVDTIFLND